MPAISFAAPERLWLLALAAGLAAAYVVVQIRRRGVAGRFASPELLPLVRPQRTGWWRHAIAVVFAAGLVLASLGAAQPTVPGQAERERATIILAVDAARAFVADLPSTFHVGLVTANSAPRVVVAPTTDHQAVQNALDNLELSPGTALGEAIFTSLAAVPTADPEADAPAAHIVLLSDGVSTTGRPDAVAVEAAVDAGVPVSTIAFGTDDPGVSVQSQGQTVAVPVDESALREIAEGTSGDFFEAGSTEELHRVYTEIDADVTVVATDRDVAEWFAAAALVLLVVAAAVSLVTTSRVVWT